MVQWSYCRALDNLKYVNAVIFTGSVTQTVVKVTLTGLSMALDCLWLRLVSSNAVYSVLRCGIHMKKELLCVIQREYRVFFIDYARER